MPRPAVCDGRPRRLAPVPGAGHEARRRTDGSNRRRPPAESRPQGGNSVFPVYAGPQLSRESGWELSGVSFKIRSRARRQSRTGHGRTRREGGPPSPPAHPPPRPSPLPKEAAPKRNGSQKNVIRGRIAPPTPARCLAGLGAPTQGLCQENCAPPNAWRSVRRAQDDRVAGVDCGLPPLQFTGRRWAFDLPCSARVDRAGSSADSRQGSA